MSGAPAPRPPRGSVDDYGVYDDAKTYYTTDERHMNTRAGARTRTYSQVRTDEGERPSTPRCVVDDDDDRS